MSIVYSSNHLDLQKFRSNLKADLNRDKRDLNRHRIEVFRKGVKITGTVFYHAVTTAISTSSLFFIALFGINKVSTTAGGNDFRTAREFKNITNSLNDFNLDAINNSQFLNKVDDIRYGFCKKDKNALDVLKSLAEIINNIGIASELAVISVELGAKLASFSEDIRAVGDLFNWVETILPGFTKFVKSIPLDGPSPLLWVSIIINAIGIPLVALDIKDKNKIIKELECYWKIEPSEQLSAEKVEKGLEYLSTLNELQQINYLKRAIVLNKPIDIANVKEKLNDYHKQCEKVQQYNSFLKRVKKHQITKAVKDNLEILPSDIGFEKMSVVINDHDEEYMFWDCTKLDIEKMNDATFSTIIKKPSSLVYKKIVKPKNLLKEIGPEKACKIIFQESNKIGDSSIFNETAVKDLKEEVSVLEKLLEHKAFESILKYNDLNLATKTLKLTDTEKANYKKLFKLVSVNEIMEIKRTDNNDDEIIKAIRKAKFVEFTQSQFAKTIFDSNFLKELGSGNIVFTTIKNLISKDSIISLIDNQKLFDRYNNSSGTIDYHNIYKHTKIARNKEKHTLEEELITKQENIKNKHTIKLSNNCIEKIPSPYLKRALKLKQGLNENKNGELLGGAILLESLRYRLKKQRSIQAVSIIVQVCAIAILLGKVVLGATLLASGGWTVAFAIAIIMVTVIPIATKIRSHFILKKANEGVLSESYIEVIKERLAYNKSMLDKDNTDKKLIEKNIKKIEKELANSVKFKDIHTKI